MAIELQMNTDKHRIYGDYHLSGGTPLVLSLFGPKPHWS